jgi:hypothetical protein
MPITPHAYLVGPLIAFGVIGALSLILWWTFGRDADPLAGVSAIHGHELAQRARRGNHERRGGHGRGAQSLAGAPEDAQWAEHEDFGLLRPALIAEDLTSAGVARARLAEAGIRATVSTGLDGRTRVLVFGEELDRARRVVDSPN